MATEGTKGALLPLATMKDVTFKNGHQSDCLRPSTIYLSLGSNIRPEENLRKAIALLRERTTLLALSKVFITAPQLDTNQPPFYNMAAKVVSSADPVKLKEILYDIEENLLRVRDPLRKNGPHTIDLDILLWDTAVFEFQVQRKGLKQTNISAVNSDLFLGQITSAEDPARINSNGKDYLFSWREQTASYPYLNDKKTVIAASKMAETDGAISKQGAREDAVVIEYIAPFEEVPMEIGVKGRLEGTRPTHKGHEPSSRATGNLHPVHPSIQHSIDKAQRISHPGVKQEPFRLPVGEPHPVNPVSQDSIAKVNLIPHPVNPVSQDPFTKVHRIPHPDILTFAHAVVPLADLDPDFVHPVAKKTLAQLAIEITGSANFMGVFETVEVF